MDAFKSNQNLCHLDWLVNVQILRYQANAGTVRTVADIMTSLNLDLMAVEEMEDEAAFRELVKRLRRVDDGEAVAVLTTSAGLCAIGIG